MTWPSVDAPATAPADHGEVRTQAYYAGGGDYFRSGYYSHGLFTSAATSTTAPGFAVGLFRPFLVPVRRTFDRIGINVTAAAGAGGVVRMGVYSHANGGPSALIVDGGSVSTTATGAREVTISQSLDPGIVWICTAFQVAGPTVTIYNNSTAVPWSTSISTAPPTSVSSVTGRLQTTGMTGALPATTTLDAGGAVMIAACLRAA